MNLTVTGLEELKELAQGKVVELPGWVEDKPFNARLKRPSMQLMAANGDIPNTLLSAATELFYNSKKETSTSDLKDITEIQMTVIKASLMEPSLEQLEEIGLTLTDEQMLAIFQYSQLGVKGLEQFRKKPKDLEDNKSKCDVSAEAK